MGQTYKVLNAAGAGTVYSTDVGQYGSVDKRVFKNGVLNTERVKGKTGLWQIAGSSGWQGSLAIEGRSDRNAPWTSVAAATHADFDANNSAVRQVTLLPQMRFRSTNTAGASPSMSMWLTEA